jgi:hypothetical protein
VGKRPVSLLALVRQLISAFRGLPTELLALELLVEALLLVPLLVPLESLLLVGLESLLLVGLESLLSVDFAKAGELKAPAVTRIIVVRTTVIANVIVFIYITTA